MRNQCLISVICLALMATIPRPIEAANNGAAPREKDCVSLGGDGFRLSACNTKVSLVAESARLKDVLRGMGRMLGAEMVLGPRVSGKITDSFEDLTLEAAVKRVTDNVAMVFEENESQEGRLVRCLVPKGWEGLKTGGRIDGKPETVTEEISSGRGGLLNPGTVELIGMDRKSGPEGASWNGRFVSGEVLVRFTAGIGEQSIDRVLHSHGLTRRRYSRLAGYHVVGLPEDLSVPQAMRWLASQTIVEMAEPNFLMNTQVVPDDPEYVEQWALGNIRAPEAWGLETGRSDVVVAVIDTGVDYLHPDLATNIWQNPGEIPANGVDDDQNGFIDDDIGWDFVATNASGCTDDDCEDRDNNPMDAQGHGTHVAGLLGGVTNNGIGIAGVSWNCKIMAVRAGYKDAEQGGVLELDDAVASIEYACDNGARVLNLSWGSDDIESTFLRSAVERAVDAGVMICAAAGNEGGSVSFYPAAYEFAGVIGVGSTKRDNGLASGSNFGGWVDVSAPGVDILSTCLGGGYCSKSGTSMATPQVAGLAALLFSRFPGWSVDLIETQLLTTVHVESLLRDKNATSGIIDCYDALDLTDGDVNRFLAGLGTSFGLHRCNGEDICEGDSDGDGDVDGTDLAGLASLLVH